LKQLNAQLLQLRSEWGIEEQLGKVLNKNRDISEFSQLVLENIENKKEIMDELRRFDEEAGQMPGEVVEEERMGYNSQEIQESIEQQRKGFIDIQSKYLDIKADIEELGELKLEINRTVAKIQKVEDQIQELELAHGRLWDQIQPRNVELKNLNSRLHSMTQKIDELERRLGQLALDISGLREKLKNALATLNRLQNSRA
jgi:chromosome segregation ATPase